MNTTRILVAKIPFYRNHTVNKVNEQKAIRSRKIAEANGYTFIGWGETDLKNRIQKMRFKKL